MRETFLIQFKVFQILAFAKQKFKQTFGSGFQIFGGLLQNLPLFLSNLCFSKFRFQGLQFHCALIH